MKKQRRCSLLPSQLASGIVIARHTHRSSPAGLRRLGRSGAPTRAAASGPASVSCFCAAVRPGGARRQALSAGPWRRLLRVCRGCARAHARTKRGASSGEAGAVDDGGQHDTGQRPVFARPCSALRGAAAPGRQSSRDQRLERRLLERRRAIRSLVLARLGLLDNSYCSAPLPPARSSMHGRELRRDVKNVPAALRDRTSFHEASVGNCPSISVTRASASKRAPRTPAGNLGSDRVPAIPRYTCAPR